LLAGSSLNFAGNIEAKELFDGQVDVVVTDGFTGNILLKTAESVAKLLVDVLREELMSGPRTQLGALLARPAFTKLRKMLDPAEVGAAPLLGVDGLVFIGHGRSDDRALYNAVRVASLAVKADLLPAMRKQIGQEFQIRNGLKQEKI
jgi:glycerol-3-phosphate acyltransferase PlsX